MSYETVSLQICEMFVCESHECSGHIFIEAHFHHGIKKNKKTKCNCDLLTAKNYELRIVRKSEF